MANANVAQRMKEIAVNLYKVQQLPHGCQARTHYSYTLKQADRAGAIALDSDGLVTKIMEPNLKFELPKGVELEDIMHPDLLMEFEDLVVPLTLDGLAQIDKKIADSA